MADYEKSGSVNAPAQKLFDFLAEVRNLPRYFEHLTRAEPGDGEEVHVEAVVPGGGHQAAEAWFKVDHDARHISWGSEDENEYSGWLTVTGDDTTSSVTIGLHMNRTSEDTDSDLDASIVNIRQLVEAGDAPQS